MKKSIGIDLGTTNSVAAFKDTEVKILRSKENEELVRSCVSLIKGSIIAGKIAYDTGLKRNPENTILSVKRLMGGGIKDKMVKEMISNNKYYKFGITKLLGGTNDSVAVLLDGKQYTPEQISAEILKKIKVDAEEKLGDEVTHAVITVPAYFTEKQKNATRIAAQLAGLKVQKLLAEPTAAAIAYGVSNYKIGDSKTVLIYDFGGGTFDISVLNIVDGQYIEAGTGGDRWLGGDDIDKQLQELIFKKVEKEYNIANLEDLIANLTQKKKNLLEAEIRVKAEEAKIQLSSSDNADVFIPNRLEDENGDIIDIEFSISRDEFDRIVKPFINKSLMLIDNLLTEIGYDISMIDNILLIGGTSCIPLVKKMLSAKYGENKILISEKPMLSVAEGAGILSHRLGEEYETPIKITETVEDISCCTNHNYFIEEKTKEGGLGYRQIIEKQMPLPATMSIILKTTVNNQKFAKVTLYSDVEDDQKEKLTTSYFTIDMDLPIQSEIIFDVELDTNEEFCISAYPRGAKDLSKNIIIGRGKKDSTAFQTIEDYTLEILSKIESWQAQDKYFEIQKEMIKLSEQIGKDQSIDPRWSEIDFKIKNAFDEAVKEDKEEQEGSRNENIIWGAIMLIREYEGIMRPADVQNLIELLKEHDIADPIQKLDIVNKVDKITDNYLDLFALYRLKSAADAAINGPGDGGLGETEAIANAAFLKDQHELILSHFQSGRKDEGYALLNEAIIVAKKYL
jgi:molecular chaperone DnaK